VLEPFEQLEPEARFLVDRLKQLQDTVGTMRDAHLLRQQIRRMLGPRSAREPFDEIVALPPPEVRPGLTLLAKRLHDLERREFQKLRRRWSARRRAEFFRRAERFALSLEAIAALSRGSAEVERKFLLSSVPPRARTVRPITIEQGWIPGEKLAERVRRATFGGRSQHFRTVKLGGGIRRIEVEERTTKAIFDALWPLTHGKRVRKTRYPVRDGKHSWEVDHFADRKLVLAEIELENESVNVSLPRWLKPYVVREVTDDPKYVNRNLAR
jgi:CYTH domain-containing protein